MPRVAEREPASESERAPRAATGQILPEFPLQGRFLDGFSLSTLDEELELNIHILDQTDFRVFTPNDRLPARSGLYIPRVRVYFEGHLTRDFEYEVSIQRSVEGVWDLLDGNLDWRLAEERLKLRFGRMLVPYSYEWYDHLEQYFITPERALFPLNFGLSRSAGIMAHGHLDDGRVQYAIGGYDGRLAGVADNNTTRDAVGYLNVRPFLKTERYPALRYLNLGGSIFGGLQVLPEEPLPLRTSLQSSENDDAARAASATFVEFEDGVYYKGGRFAAALHMALYAKGWSLEAEGQVARFEFLNAPRNLSASLPVTGFHVTLGYFLTGEEVTKRSTVIPRRPWGRQGGFGGAGSLRPV